MAEDSALTRFANSEIHQNVAETQRRGQPALRRSASGSASPRPAGPTPRACAGWPRTPPRSPGSSRSSRTGAACPARRAIRDVAGGLQPGDRRGHARSSAPRASAPSSPRPTTRASRPTARSRPGPRRSPSPTRTGVARRRDADDVAAPHRVDGPGRRHRLRRGGRGRRDDDRCRGDRPRGGRARRARRPTRSRSTPGDYPVVLEEYAVVDLLDMLGYLGFSALAVQEERSVRRARQADRQRPRDDRRRRPRPGRAADGLRLRGRRQAARRRSSSAGVCRDVVYDAQTAARDGVALDRPRPAGPEPVGPVPAQHGHGAPATTPREELIGGLDRGLLVTRFHYTNPVHPKLAIVTGMTRDGTFLVEGGRIVGPVRNLRFTQSYLDGAGRDGRGRPRAQDAQGLPRRGRSCPAVRIDGWTFTGATEH